MSRIPFQEKELEIVRMHRLGGAVALKDMGLTGIPNEEPIFNRPITEKENFKLLFSGKKPYWTPVGGWAFCDINVFRPRLHPDNVATHIIFDGEPSYQYKDLTMRSSWFDLDWVFVPVAGGATVKPGEPKVPDMSEWETYISMPNLDDLDWEHVAQKNKEYLDTPQMNQLGILSGFWERLISLMDVEGAAVALIDEDQQEGVHRFFDQYADLLIDYIDRMKKRCDIDCVLIHDDWGHQNGGFFSLDTAMEMLVPYLKRVTDAVHERGMYFELHSCGKNEALVPAYIAAGVDLWCPQPINDIAMLAEKYKDQPIFFGQQQPIEIPEGATPQEIEKLAQDWFDQFKDCHVIAAFIGADPAFMQALYRISRIAYSKCED